MAAVLNCWAISPPSRINFPTSKNDFIVFLFLSKHFWGPRKEKKWLGNQIVRISNEKVISDIACVAIRYHAWRMGWMRMTHINMLECLVFGWWKTFGGATLGEVCQWEWVLNFQNPEPFPSSKSLTCLPWWSRALPSGTLSPKLNVLCYKFLQLWCLFTVTEITKAPWFQRVMTWGNISTI